MPYVDIRHRGSGGFGTVSEVQDQDGNRFARKTLVVPNGLDKASVKRRFHREVKFQKSIHHENVVRIVDEDLAADPPWFIMTLATETLEDELRQNRTLGGNPHLALFHILNGLEEIHRRGFCHRDLKPANVLRYDQSSGPLYALSDFGLMAVGEEASSTLTPSGIGGGTPRYAAPECAVNFHRATSRSDIYSFGALLHDVFVGAVRKIPHQELTGPGEMGRVIEKCTRRNQHRRFKNVAELREALFDALNKHVFVFESGEEKKVVELLDVRDRALSSDEWDEIFDFVDERAEKKQSLENAFRALRIEHIQALASEDPGLIAGMGKLFSDFVREGAFGFDYCDVLAGKAQEFYSLGDTGLRAEIAVGMLKLGTSHNRWFVEHKFMNMSGNSIDDDLGDRIVAEIGALEIDFKKEFAHLSGSISANSEQLHPAIRALLTA